MNHTLFAAATVALSFLACSAPSAGTIYKSIGSDGVVRFSDTPPEDVDPREPPRLPDAVASRRATMTGQGPLDEEKLRALDAGVQRADLRVDLAEHALAIARRSTWVVLPSYRSPARMTGDSERIAFYKKDGFAARQALLEELQDMRQDAVGRAFTVSSEVSIGSR